MNKDKVSTIIITAVITFLLTAGAGLIALRKQGEFNVIVPSKYSKQLTKALVLRKQLENKYVYKISDEKLFDGMYKGLVDSLNDPYTVYMNKKEIKSFMEDVQASYAGVGMMMSPDKKNDSIVVVVPFKGAPAYKAGIKPGDNILKVNGEKLTSKDMNKAISIMKGKVGKKVVMEVYRPSTKKTLNKVLYTENISIPTVDSKVKEGNIGYIRISQFAEKTAADFISQLDELKSKGIKGLIIDVRDNPGGYYDQVVEICDALLPKATIVYTIDKYGHKEVESSDEEHKTNLPMAVLVNGQSASASEILSGALKDNKKAVLIGTRTFGKGLVQSTFPLSDGSATKITIAKYYTPSKVCIQGKGIEPDIKSALPDGKESTLDLTTKEKDTQLDKALGYIEKKIK